MNEGFDRARFIVYHLRSQGLQITLDDREIDVKPMSKLRDNQSIMLQTYLTEVVLFLRCESAVVQFLAGLISDVKTG